ncbi:hypothetical protein SBDP1_930016 [Syntrophobacter sp. SbD1]|nr:hypothetical protein SBDP1_930016 [Syntrophobacter sp. SbD1]
MAGTESLELIVSPDANFWHDTWAEIQAPKPELGKLKVKHEEVDKRRGQKGNPGSIVWNHPACPALGRFNHGKALSGGNLI